MDLSRLSALVAAHSLEKSLRDAMFLQQMGYTGAPGFFMPTPLMSTTASTTTRAPTFLMKTPVTTVFVGNITDKAPNEFIRQILSECGRVANWKRIQGSNGKFQAFGFCDFESPDGTLRALRILNEYQLADKKLVVKAEDKTKDLCRDFWQKRRVQRGLSVEKLVPGQLPVDDDALREDEEAKQRIMDSIHAEHPELVPAEDGELTDKDKEEEERKKKEEEKKREEAEKEKERVRAKVCRTSHCYTHRPWDAPPRVWCLLNVVWAWDCGRKRGEWGKKGEIRFKNWAHARTGDLSSVHILPRSRKGQLRELKYPHNTHETSE